MKIADLDLCTDYLLSTLGAETKMSLSAMDECEVSSERLSISNKSILFALRCVRLIIASRPAHVQFQQFSAAA